jgi:hypothetical protein
VRSRVRTGLFSPQQYTIEMPGCGPSGTCHRHSNAS